MLLGEYEDDVKNFHRKYYTSQMVHDRQAKRFQNERTNCLQNGIKRSQFTEVKIEIYAKLTNN